MVSLRSTWFSLVLSLGARAQAPGVPIHSDSVPPAADALETKLIAAAEKLRTAGALPDLGTIRAQLARRTCELVLPRPGTTPATGPKILARARAAFVTIGFHYKCTHCDEWHLDTGGGYAIAADGVVATAHHVIAPDDDEMREGYLFCADDAGNVFPVREVLACDQDTDVAILRTDAKQLVPLPLRVDVWPGEAAFTYGDPMGTRGYFSTGIVNRFANEPVEGKSTQRVVMNVSTDWAPGSSGAAVLDGFGNAIGHATTISTHGEEVPAAADDEAEATEKPPRGMETYMVLHTAARAADVLALVKPKADAKAPAESPR